MTVLESSVLMRDAKSTEERRKTCIKDGRGGSVSCKKTKQESRTFQGKGGDLHSVNGWQKVGFGGLCVCGEGERGREAGLASLGNHNLSTTLCRRR
jgi:hypothetical protein